MLLLVCNGSDRCEQRLLCTIGSVLCKPINGGLQVGFTMFMDSRSTSSIMRDASAMCRHEGPIRGRNFSHYYPAQRGHKFNLLVWGAVCAKTHALQHVNFRMVVQMANGKW